jgi:hypothetical protein
MTTEQLSEWVISNWPKKPVLIKVAEYPDLSVAVPNSIYVSTTHGTSKYVENIAGVNSYRTLAFEPTANGDGQMFLNNKKEYTNLPSASKYAKILFVSPSGDNDTGSPGYPDLPYLTVSQAGDTAADLAVTHELRTLVYVKRGTYVESGILRKNVDMYFEDEVVVYHATLAVLRDNHASLSGGGNQLNVFGNGTFACLAADPYNDKDTINLNDGNSLYVEARDVGTIQNWGNNGTQHLEVKNAICRFNTMAGANTQKSYKYTNCKFLTPFKLDTWPDNSVTPGYFYDCEFNLLEDYTYLVNSDLWVITDYYNETTINYSNTAFLAEILPPQPSVDDLLSFVLHDDVPKGVGVLEAFFQGPEPRDFKFFNCEFIIHRDFSSGIYIRQSVVENLFSLVFSGCRIIDKSPSKSAIAIIAGKIPGNKEPNIDIHGLSHNCKESYRVPSPDTHVEMAFSYKKASAGTNNIEPNLSKFIFSLSVKAVDQCDIIAVSILDGEVFSHTPSTLDIPNFINANEILIEGNTIWVFYNFTFDNSSPAKVVRLENVYVDKADYSVHYKVGEIQELTIGGTTAYSVHGTTLDATHIYGTSRTTPTSVSKIPKYDMAALKIHTYPSSQGYNGGEVCHVYKDNLYIQLTSATPSNTPFKLTKVNVHNFESSPIIIDDTDSGNSYAQVFALYNGYIIVVKGAFGIPQTFQKYTLEGELIQSVVIDPEMGNEGGYHSVAIKGNYGYFAGIYSKVILKVDLDTLTLVDAAVTSNSTTDDIAFGQDGYIYLTTEKFDYGGVNVSDSVLYKVDPEDLSVQTLLYTFPETSWGITSIYNQKLLAESGDRLESFSDKILKPIKAVSGNVSIADMRFLPHVDFKRDSSLTSNFTIQIDNYIDGATGTLLLTNGVAEFEGPQVTITLPSESLSNSAYFSSGQLRLDASNNSIFEIKWRVYLRAGVFTFIFSVDKY